MSSQVWTIFGVVVGASLSFAAQWLMARQQRVDERTRESQRTQREAYARFISALHRTLLAVTKFANNDPDEPTAFEGLRAANIELQDCIGLIGLVAPKDTYDAASLLGDLTLKSWEGGRPPTNADRERVASAAFMALARRDVGIAMALA